MTMQTLIANAKQIDEKRSQELVDQQAKLNTLHKWQRDTKKLYAWMIRTMELPPSEEDQKKLELAMHLFKKND